MTDPRDAAVQPPARKTVLVVDDDETIRLMLRKILEHAGYEVIVAENGEHAIAMLERVTPSIVILDVMMPRVNGMQVAEHIRADPHTKEVPIILVSAASSEGAIEAGFAAGADDFVTKPISRSLLLARMESSLRAREARIDAARAREEQATHQAMVRDLEEARAVQRSLLPTLPVTFDDWTATGGIVPWGHVGGDAIDVMNGMDGAKIAVVVDVSGHGVAAALLAASVCSTLRRLVKARPLVESLLELEAELSASNSSGKYACVAAVERRGDVVTIVNAGLPPVAILRGGGVVESVVASGAPLGLLPDPSFEPTHIQTLRGDRIVLMSDGLTEPFGLADDLSSCIESLQLADPTWPLAPPAVLVREIVGLFGPGSPQTDDATLLVLERR